MSLDCLVWKTNPLWWQAVAALEGAKAAGVVNSRAACEAQVETGSSIGGLFKVPPGLSKSFGKCACAFVFDEDDAPAPRSYWRDWEPIGGTGYSSLSVPRYGQLGAVALAPHIIDLYICGADRFLYQKSWTGAGWVPAGTEWKPLDVSRKLRSAPCVVSLGPMHRDVYAVAEDGSVIHKAWDGNWRLWEGIGRPGNGALGPVGAVAVAPNIIDLYVAAADGFLYQKTWLGFRWEPGGADWRLLDGSRKMRTGPSVVSLNPKHRDVYAVAEDGSVMHKAWDGQWRSWEGIGGVVKGLDVVATADGFIDIYARGQDDFLWQKTWTGGGWVPSGLDWHQIDASMRLDSSPSVVSLGPMHRDVYARGAERQVFHRAWAP